MIRTAATLLGLALAAVPAAALQTVRVQGVLTDARGRTLTGAARLDFRLVDPATRAEIWSEAHEVQVARGVFVAFLGARERLPAPSELRSRWRLIAEPPMGSGWSVAPLTEPEDDLRRAQLGRLMTRLGMEGSRPAPPMPLEYRRLLAGGAAGFAPPDTISDAPECSEDVRLDGLCPRPLQKVIDREEKLLRKRLALASRQKTPRPEPRMVIGLTAR